MRKLFLVLSTLALGPALAAGAITGCSNVVLQEETASGEGGGGGGDGGNTTTTGAGAHKPDGGKDAFDDYVDPGCPDAGPPIVDFQCDPYDQFNGDCAPGEGCYIYVEYPSEPCGQEIYGAVCAPQGFGQQGDGCNGALDCGAGFVCVVTGGGNQCVELCPLVGEDGCPPGLVCEPIDVEGFGGCL